MARSLGFPGPADVAAQTPADRDRAIDVIRIVSLVAVVVGHTIMATSIIRDRVFSWDNLLTTSVVFQALTWIFQIMPLFFFAGAAACVQSWHPGASWGGWLMKRCTRLFRPVFYYLAFVMLRPLENNPLPGWDGGRVGAPGRRSATVGTLLCIAGAATLASVKWGLKDEGLYCVAVMLVTLVSARLLATDAQVPAASQRTPV